MNQGPPFRNLYIFIAAVLLLAICFTTLSRGSGSKPGTTLWLHTTTHQNPPVESCLKKRADLTESQLCYKNNLVNLKELEGDLNQINTLYTHFFYGVPEPPQEKRIFAPASENTVLEVVLIELRHLNNQIQGLLPAIYNIGHIYGGTQVALTVIYHTAHDTALAYTQSTWPGVRWIKVDGTKAIHDYNQMLTSVDFWDQFDSQFILVTQTDTMIYRPLEDDFFAYEYLGAPWPFEHSVCNYPRPNVGNGGYSLRNVSFHKRVVATQTYDNETPEDAWWCRRIDHFADLETATRFAVEHVWYDGVPTGSHQLHLMGSFFKSANYFRTFIQNNYPAEQACQELTC